MFSKLKGNSQESESVPEDTPSASGAAPATPEPPRARAPAATPLPGVLSQAMKPAIISEQFTFRGDIDSDGTLHVEGRVIGIVRAQTIHVSATGQIEGEVICENLTVKGQVQGKVTCQEFTIAATARVRGQVAYRFITVGSGARVECEMTIRA